MNKSRTKTQDPCFTHFDGCLYFTAGRLFRLIDRLAFESFKSLGFAPSHAFLLMVLSECKGAAASPTALSSIMNLDRSTVTRLVNQLEKLKLIRRTKSGRHSVIQLLPAGRTQLPQVRSCWNTLSQRITQVLGKSQATQLNDTIVHLTEECEELQKA